MDGRKFDEALERALQRDFSAGTEAFRDESLARCLEALGSNELGDGDLELLATVGDPFGDNEDASNSCFLDTSGKGRAC